MIEKAVIDRFEEDKAVLLVGDVQRQIVIPSKSLPHGAKEGSWLRVIIEDEVIQGITLDEDETNKARQRIAEKLERLRRGIGFNVKAHDGMVSHRLGNDRSKLTTHKTLHPSSDDL